jgi:glycerophosphoryl diester phosphodiesterase
MPSFLLALGHGADGLELDAHVTKDGVVVVHHDEMVKQRPITDATWRELSRIDLGGGHIPKLQDVLDAVGDRATVYIELKGQRIEERVIDVARKHGHRFAMHSFDHDAIARIEKRAPEIPRGILFDRDTPQPLDQLRRQVERLRPRDVWPHWSLVTEQFVTTARELGARVIVWTVNSPGTAGILASLGVDGVCTDDVRLLANL